MMIPPFGAEPLHAVSAIGGGGGGGGDGDRERVSSCISIAKNRVSQEILNFKAYQIYRIFSFKLKVYFIHLQRHGVNIKISP
jgi:hypothetical protein